MYEVYGGLGNQCLGNYNIYDSPIRSNYSDLQLQQCCCSTADMLNRWQAQQTMNSIQSQMQSLKNYENVEKLINSIKPIKFEEEKGKDMICKNISNYMNKEFLYESELKEIEDKFHFKFEDLGFSDINNKIYKISKEITDKLKVSKDKYVSKITVYEYGCTITNSVYIYCNDRFCWDITIESNYIKNSNKDKIKDMCNIILKQEDPGYQKFYEKYKNRIVKDYECEDLSFYEKILQESS